MRHWRNYGNGTVRTPLCRWSPRVSPFSSRDQFRYIHLVNEKCGWKLFERKIIIFLFRSKMSKKKKEMIGCYRFVRKSLIGSLEAWKKRRKKKKKEKKWRRDWDRKPRENRYLFPHSPDTFCIQVSHLCWKWHFKSIDRRLGFLPRLDWPCENNCAAKLWASFTRIRP